MKEPRRAGARWRLLVHGVPGRNGDSGPAHKVLSSPKEAERIRQARQQLGNYPTKADETVTVLPNTEFDELVVGRWLHIEEMDTGYWWMNIGGVTVHVKADRDGKPKWVRVDGPGDYDGPVEGCEYQLEWTAPSRYRSSGGSDG